MFVLQNSELYGTLDISDTAHFKNNIVVDTSAHILSTLEIDGTSTFHDQVFCKDLVKFENGVDVTGNAVYRNQLTAKDHVQSDSTLTVQGTTTTNGELVTNGGTRFESLTVANADVSFNNHTKLNTLVVSNQADFNGTTNLNGSTTFVDNAEIKDLTITGETSFDGSGAIQVGQDVHINSSKLKINNNVYLNNRDTQVDNNTDFDIVVDKLFVRLITAGEYKTNGQESTLFDNIDVSGIATFNGQAVFNEQASFSDLSMNIGDIAQSGDPALITTDFNVFAKQGSGQGFIYNGDVTIGNSRNNHADVSMDVYGDLTIHDSGTLHVTGPSILHSSEVQNELLVLGNTDLCGNTNTRDLYVNDDLTVEKESTFNGNVTINADATITETARIYKDLIVDGSFSVSGLTTFINTKNLDVSDNIIVLNSIETSRDSGILIKRNGGNNAFIGYDEPSNGFKLGMTTYDGTQAGSNITIDSDLAASKLEVGEFIALDTNLTGQLDVNGDVRLTGTLFADSDRNIKTNIIRLDNCLDKVDRICGYSYTRLDLEDKTKRHMGVIAQEVEEIYPELVEENEENNKKSVNYSGLVPVLLECVKTLKDENAVLRNRLEKMEQFMAKQFGL